MGDAAKSYDDWWEPQFHAHKIGPRWPDASLPVLAFTDNNSRHIQDAEFDWEHGLSVFTAEFGVWQDASRVVGFLGSHDLMRHWTRTLSAIVGIGWSLHTWTPEVDEPFYRAFAVFVRPNR